MKNNQKIILIFIIILLVFTSFLAIFISSNIKDKDVDNVNNSSNKPRINKQITRLDDFDELYAVQNSINTIFSNIENPSELLKYFDNDYIISNNLTENNILNFLDINMDYYSLTVEEIYYNDNSDITYYFVKGYVMQYSMLGDAKYFKDRYYLLVVDQNSHYSLRPLYNITNLEEYAKNYALGETTINNNSSFIRNKIEDETKIITYINNFLVLMFLDSTKAYNMLDDETKESYPSIISFNNDRENINNSLFTKFNATSIKENEDNTVYKVQGFRQSTITITEYYPNDYKIGFRFN